MLDGRGFSVNAWKNPNFRISVTTLAPWPGALRELADERGSIAANFVVLFRLGEDFRKRLPIIALPAGEQVFGIPLRKTCMFKLELGSSALR